MVKLPNLPKTPMQYEFVHYYYSYTTLHHTVQPQILNLAVWPKITIATVLVDLRLVFQ